MDSGSPGVVVANDFFEDLSAPPPPEAADSARPPKKTRSRPASVVGDASSGAAPGAPKKSKKDFSWELKLKAECSGKPCTACGRSDRSQDPTQPEHTRLWARFTVKDQSYQTGEQLLCVVLEKDGSTCWYCFRAHNVVYRPRWTLSQWKTNLTDTKNHPGLQDELGKYALWLVTIVIDHFGAGQSRDTLPQMRWPTATEMKRIEIVEVSWSLPKERQHVKLNVVYVFVVFASVHNRCA